MPRGYDRALYILPFDHRGSFHAGMFGWKPPLSDAQTAEVAHVKQVIYDGFTAALAAGVPKQKAGILVDEQFGAAILRDAAAHSIATACPEEKSGQEEFDFEYGEEFSRHVETVDPTFCKALVRYNPQGDRDLNKRQAARLQRLSEYLAARNRSRFMVELLVPANKCQLERFGGDKTIYDRELRPRLMIEAIRELQEAGVEPDLWKVEGLDRREDCGPIIDAVRAGGRDHQLHRIGSRRGRAEGTRVARIGGRGAGVHWLAVGRTEFWDPLIAWRRKRATREQAVTEIARRYRGLVDLFEQVDKPLPPAFRDRAG
jgi:myo-inositol catabolism protein IolC